MTILLIVALMRCVILIIYQRPRSDAREVQANLRGSWIAVTVVLTAFCIRAGLLVNGRAAGILIDDRNWMSLSRLQWVAWFSVLLRGYFTEAIWNAANSRTFPYMQADLWVLLGITGATAVSSNLIVDNKK